MRALTIEELEFVGGGHVPGTEFPPSDPRNPWGCSDTIFGCEEPSID
jgi:hypothetical protein